MTRRTERSERTREVAIVSLRFSPAHVSHLIAYGKLLQELGWESLYILDQPYLSFADFASIAPTVSSQAYITSPDLQAFDSAIFYNAAIRNPFLAHAMRRRGIEIFYVFHEPVPLLQRGAESLKVFFTLMAANCSSIAMARRSSAILVASEYAQALYRAHYSRYNHNVFLLPLLFEDESNYECGVDDVAQRQYFSFLGNAVESHGFSDFVDFVKYTVHNGCPTRFAIGTQSNLSALLSQDKELSELVRTGTVRIEHGRPLSNQEMNRLAQESFCVWNVYRLITQSGALARAFMNGTPVVAAPIGGMIEFLKPGVNGEFVGMARDFESIREALHKIRTNLPQYVIGSRETFRTTFHYRAHMESLTRILS